MDLSPRHQNYCFLEDQFQSEDQNRGRHEAFGAASQQDKQIESKYKDRAQKRASESRQKTAQFAAMQISPDDLPWVRSLGQLEGFAEDEEAFLELPERQISEFPAFEGDPYDIFVCSFDIPDLADLSLEAPPFLDPKFSLVSFYILLYLSFNRAQLLIQVLQPITQLQISTPHVQDDLLIWQVKRFGKLALQMISDLRQHNVSRHAWHQCEFQGVVFYIKALLQLFYLEGLMVQNDTAHDDEDLDQAINKQEAIFPDQCVRVSWLTPFDVVECACQKYSLPSLFFQSCFTMI